MTVSPSRRHKSASQAGYSLLELSMVLLIMGLLVGGTLVGQSLIAAAEVRKLITNLDTYRTAYNVFRERYNCLPGDCPRATNYFADYANGNGDGYISCKYETWATYCTGQIDERGEAIKHILAAQLLPVGTGSSINMTGAGLRECRIQYFASGLYDWYGNVLRVHFPLQTSPWNADCMTPEEAESVDTKLDDGSPSSGDMLARRIDSSEPYSDCADVDYSLPKQKGNYNTNNDELACSLFYALD